MIENIQNMHNLLIDGGETGDGWLAVVHSVPWGRPCWMVTMVRWWWSSAALLLQGRWPVVRMTWQVGCLGRVVASPFSG